MRIVLDANIYISALISQSGNPYQIIERWQRYEYDVLISTAILAEIGRVLRYPRIVKRHHLGEPEILRYLEFIRKFGIIIVPDETITAIEDDETGNRYLECAVAGKARYIVTGDEHLLKAQQFRGIFVLKPAEFVALLLAADGGRTSME